jgi:hypothetical protein
MPNPLSQEQQCMSLTILTHKSICRFLENHYKGNPNECWLWCGSIRRTSDGYGRIEYREDGIKYQFLAHRISYLYYNNLNQIDDSIIICHSCDNPRCVNPNHLVAADRDWNNKDAMAKGLNQHGEGHYATPFTENDIRQIRYLAHCGLTSQHIANKYGVCRQSIDNIINYKTWKHI